MFKKLEVYYLANKSDNLYFTLLGDCKPSKIEKRKGDKEIVLAGIHCTNELNKKYNKEIFNFCIEKEDGMKEKMNIQAGKGKEDCLCNLILS